ncbi:MAG: GNAT family N-acetyltransferase [Calditrichaeota bacterium]|nr:MAG: GNAT family N-acetyltransferase [Calditrichota bacterium]MBL1207269.1 GNAT family N-acetyltransferase [Calditrichota bacterium]NOG47102.1 GNAT family N-acetyltransferase [Calditrichota bacterium]
MRIEIVPYKPKYYKIFNELNKEWINAYFRMEAADLTTLNNPTKYIIDKGGFIFIALFDDQPVGVVAMLKMNDPLYDFELAKMAVSQNFQGKGIGYQLGEAVIRKAKMVGARNVYLESNTKLKPAIALYKKLGFKKIAQHETPYERCNIQMGIELF